MVIRGVRNFYSWLAIFWLGPKQGTSRHSTHWRWFGWAWWVWRGRDLSYILMQHKHHTHLRSTRVHTYQDHEGGSCIGRCVASANMEFVHVLADKLHASMLIDTDPKRHGSARHGSTGIREGGRGCSATYMYEATFTAIKVVFSQPFGPLACSLR